MRNRSFVSLLAVGVLAVGIAGCSGGDEEDKKPDAGISLPPDAAKGAPDAKPTFTIDAAPQRGTVKDLDFSAAGKCNTSNDCANPTSDCVSLTSTKICIAKCAKTSECATDLFCVPAGITNGSIANHCWVSICGQDRSNGVTGGACKIGADRSLPAADQKEGICDPIDDDHIGLCWEVGAVAIGAACDPPLTGGARKCNAQGFCFAPGEATEGTCIQRCDPKKVLSGEATGCPEGTGCVDVSSMELEYDSDESKWLTNKLTLGLCDTGKACSTVAATSGCPDGTACGPTNPLRETGWCDKDATGGQKALDATCTAQTGETPPPAAERCVAGVYCAKSGPAVATTCQTPCDLDAQTNPCTTGTCKKIFWNAGSDAQSADDDEYTIGWGTCQP